MKSRKFIYKQKDINSVNTLTDMERISVAWRDGSFDVTISDLGSCRCKRIKDPGLDEKNNSFQCLTTFITMDSAGETNHLFHSVVPNHCLQQVTKDLE